MLHYICLHTMIGIGPVLSGKEKPRCVILHRNLQWPFQAKRWLIYIVWTSGKEEMKGVSNTGPITHHLSPPSLSKGVGVLLARAEKKTNEKEKKKLFEKCRTLKKINSLNKV